MAHPLDPLFRPRSLAILGASNDPNKVGGRPLAFLLKAGWAGRLVPVNPGATTVQGLPAARSLAEVEGEIEQLIVALPALQVPGAVAEAIKRGVKALQLFSAEVTLDAALLAQARTAGLRILGPNSLGLFNAVDGFFGTFATALDGAWPRAPGPAGAAGAAGAGGGVGVATQSGAFGSYFFGLAQQCGLRFSHFVATGNELDIDVADCIDFLADDAATTLIVIALEGCRDGRKLSRALHKARAAGKPVLAMKVGVSTAGAAAAATHTGALAGADRVFDAVLREAGAVRVHSLEALVDAALLAATGPRPAGRDVLVLTTSGGVGVLAADEAEAQDLALPPVSDAALASIRAAVPLADGRNPVDSSAGILGDLGLFARIAELALADRRFDAVLCFLAHVPRNAAHWAQLREPLLALRARHDARPFVLVALADAAIGADLEAQQIALFADPTRALRALAALAPRADAAAAASAGAGRLPSAGLLDGLPDGLLAGPPDGGDDPTLRLEGPLQTEAQAQRALAAAGIAFAPERVVRDADEATAAAHELGWPLVLKIVSPDLPHKTEAGGVVLGLADEAALRAALPAMAARVALRAPQARQQGFLLARQLQGGVEMLVGTQRDPVFGPVVTVGAGGVLAELLDDAAVALAPLDEAQALRLLQSTRAAKLLAGHRGAPAADLRSLSRLVARLSRIAWANRESVVGIDLNPVLARPDGAFALDALVVTDPAPVVADPAPVVTEGEPA